MRASFLADSEKLPFQGVDIWRAWELGCLQNNGKPLQLLGRLQIPADSPYHPESKSLKLYLHRLGEQRMAGRAELCETLARELGTLTQSSVQIECDPVENPGAAWQPSALPGISLDTLEVAHQGQGADARLLRTGKGEWRQKTVHTHLFRSLCPLSGRPDWASILIRYSGTALCMESLLAYLLSFRRQKDFHEACIEKIFCDLLHCAQPQELAVCGMFVRRGGLDISPLRWLPGETPPAVPRLFRQ